LGTRRDRPLDERGVHGPSLGVDVDQHRLGIGIENSCDGRYECSGDGDDFVSGLDSHSKQRQMQSRSAGIYGNSVIYSAKFSEILLESRDTASLPVCPAPQHLESRHFQLEADSLVLLLQIKKRDHEALRKGLISIGVPRCLNDRTAHSRISTTRKPLTPEVIGTEFDSIVATKCSIAVKSASFTESCGAHMSPMRYDTRSVCFCSAPLSTTPPRS